MNYRTSITLLASSIEIGDTIRELCPRCEGGSSCEKSLSITRSDDGQLVWQCFRANCSEKGGSSSNIVVRKVIEEKPHKEFEGTTQTIPAPILAKLESMWGITNPPYWYYTEDFGGRIAMSIRSPKYTHRGWVLRDIGGRAKTKAYTYLDKNEEALSWYKTHKDKPTVLVEDIPSAVRASRYVNSIALLGTAIGTNKAIEIAENASTPIIIALDQDATNKSFDHMKRWGLLWGTTELIVLDKDMKDMNEEELEEILS